MAGFGRRNTAAVKDEVPEVEFSAPDENVTVDETPTDAVTAEVEALANGEPTPEVKTQVDADIENAIAESGSDGKGKRRGAPRGPRQPINVGDVIVRKSARTDFTTRATPTDNNPVFLAVKHAEVGEPTDILVAADEKKIAGTIAILRRAGTKLNLGMHIAPKGTPGTMIDLSDGTSLIVGAEGYPVDPDTGNVIVTFKTDHERKAPAVKSDVTA